jgi:signal transduction histidine kinase
MWAIDSSLKNPLGALWLVFASVNAWLMFILPGKETIPYHLIWASFALLYGLFRWSLWTTWIVFMVTTAITGVALVQHARSGIIGWEECSEIVLMGVLVALLIWHVRRYQLSQQHLAEQREAEQSHAEQREIAARFGSHEMRTRLTIARGFTDLIRERTNDSSIASDATVVLSELDKASSLATMLLTLVRVETPSVWVPLNLAELVENVLGRWSAAADRAWASDVRVGMILGSAERLEAALDCLIENAVKFTSVGDLIAVQARAFHDEVQLTVSDTGAGIPEIDRPRVTEVFCTGSTAGDRAGSGLGLAIVRAVVESRGGSLEIDSEPGAGTAVTLRIPGAHPTVDPALDDASGGLVQVEPVHSG